MVLGVLCGHPSLMISRNLSLNGEIKNEEFLIVGNYLTFHKLICRKLVNMTI